MSIVHLFAVKERKKKRITFVLFERQSFVDNIMGNRKSSSSSMMSIAAITSKLSQQNVNPSESDEQKNKWNLTERDTAFLISQTGKYKY